jgi:SAM-dependent methyltransferase
MMGWREKETCRLCSSKVDIVFDFGPVHMTGVFVEDGRSVERAPITYGICSACGLNQLVHNYDSSLLYGETYGYESHLNSEMREHLSNKAKVIERLFLYESNASVLDIASNDGTFLNCFSPRIEKMGVDPLIDVVGDYYPQDARKVVDFFSSNVVLSQTNGKLFDVVTSNSVLYDLDSPLEFARDVARVLKPGGIWHFEQSYLPKMVETLSFDTICHEHLLYLGATQIARILNEVGLYVVDASLNRVNGGSIALTARKGKEKSMDSPQYFDYLLKKEITEGYLSGDRIASFFDEVKKFRYDFLNLLNSYSEKGYKLFGIGASTKGNMLMQYCDLNSRIISKIGEINPRKFGKQTPGSAIGIVNESELLEEMVKEKSLGVVFPWHFRDSIRKATSNYVSKGGKLLYPLPKLEIENY